MAFRSFSMLFLPILIAFLLSQALSPNFATAEINKFCLTATHKQLCTRMAKGATTLKDATLNCIHVALDVAKRFQTMTPAILKASDHMTPDTKSQIMDACSDSFTDTIDDLNLSIELVNKGDMGGVGTRLSASFDSMCADSLKEQGVQIPVLDKLNGHFAKVVDNTLAVAFQS